MAVASPSLILMMYTPAVRLLTFTSFEVMTVSNTFFPNTLNISTFLSKDNFVEIYLKGLYRVYLQIWF